MFINSSTYRRVLAGCTMYVSLRRGLGEFYAQDLGPGNLEMLARFFDKYPEYAEKTFLSVKVRVSLVMPCVTVYVGLTYLVGRE